MLVFQTLVEVELFPSLNAFFYSSECAFMLATRVKTPCWLIGGNYCHEINESYCKFKMALFLKNTFLLRSGYRFSYETTWIVILVPGPF